MTDHSVLRSFLVVVALMLVLTGCQVQTEDPSFPTSTPLSDHVSTTTTTISSSRPVSTTESSATTTTATGSAAETKGLVFDVSNKVRVRSRTGIGTAPGDVKGHILRSPQDLQEARLEELELYDYRDTLDTAAYTEAFFEDKALVLVYVTLSSGSLQLTFNRLTVKDVMLTVHYTITRHTTTVSADMAYWCAVIEVDREAVQEITSLVGSGTQVNLATVGTSG